MDKMSDTLDFEVEATIKFWRGFGFAKYSIPGLGVGGFYIVVFNRLIPLWGA